MTALLLTILLGLLQQEAVFEMDAAHGTDLEWMVLGSIVLPAIAIVMLVYLGRKETV